MVSKVTRGWWKSSWWYITIGVSYNLRGFSTSVPPRTGIVNGTCICTYISVFRSSLLHVYLHHKHRKRVKYNILVCNVQGGSNMTGTDLYVNKPHCAAAVRP